MLERYLETEEILSIPLSGNKYSVDIYGTIYDEEFQIVEPTLDENEEKVVTLPLWCGFKQYKVAEVLLFTFKPTNVPYPYWDRLRAMFADGNPKNIHPSNLVWKHPVGMESRKYPGYAFIPGYSRYLINKEGTVIKHSTGKQLKPYIAFNNYARYSMAPDVKRPLQNSEKMQRHRAVALAWLDYPNNADKLVVNHIDCIPGSDHVSNLEWATHKENSQHSILTGRHSRQEIIRDVYVFNAKSGLLSKYTSPAECFNDLEISSGTLFSRLARSHTKIYPGFLQFSYSKEHPEWVVLDEDKLKELKDLWDSKVLVRNAKTKQVKTFPTAIEAAKYLGIKTEAVRYLILKNHQPILPGYLQVQKSSNKEKWREPENLKQENREALFGTAVLARNVNTGVITEYASAVECSKALGLCNEAVNARFNYGSQKVFSDGYQFKRKADPTPWNFEIGKEEVFADISPTIPVRARDVFTNEQWSFRTIDEACEYFKLARHVVVDRKENKENRPYFNLEFRFNNEEFRNYDSIELEFVKQAISEGTSFRGRGYILTNIETGEETLFHNRDGILKKFGGAKRHINRCCTSGGIFRKKYRIRYYYN